MLHHMSQSGLIEFRSGGMYCPLADLFIDPSRPQKKAIITHAHADHARSGMGSYLAHKDSEEVLKLRLGSKIQLETVDYNQPFTINGVKFSLHPAGHIYGSAQVRLEHKGEVWVISGDYKIEDDGFCTPFEPVACHHFVTESTFAMPFYQWQPQQEVFDRINSWWRSNKAQGINTVLFAYSLGKAQRLIANLDLSIAQVYVHETIRKTNIALKKNGAALPDLPALPPDVSSEQLQGSLIITPSSALTESWAKQLEPYATAVCSGWMMSRNSKKRRTADRGFVLSDHADWHGLNQAIGATGAEHIYVDHGYTAVYSKWLREQGLNAQEVRNLLPDK